MNLEDWTGSSASVFDGRIYQLPTVADPTVETRFPLGENEETRSAGVAGEDDDAAARCN